MNASIVAGKLIQHRKLSLGRTLPDTDIDYFDEGPAHEANDFASWYQRTTERLKHGQGPVFFGKTQPFPLNSAYRPNTPVPDAFKEKLFALWTNDPQKWTPRELSNQFKVSIERAKAIIKLKTLQRRMKRDGLSINQGYVEKMESNLGAKAPAIAESNRNLLEEHDITRTLKPMLVAVSSHVELTPEQAAVLIDRKLRPIIAAIDADFDANMPYDPNPPCDKNIDELKEKLFIRHDADASTRWKFVFVDNNRKIDASVREVVIREPSGTLRRAMPVERSLEQKIAAKDYLTAREMKRLGILPKNRPID